jgi:hypothetical protein
MHLCLWNAHRRQASDKALQALTRQCFSAGPDFAAAVACACAEATTRTLTYLYPRQTHSLEAQRQSFLASHSSDAGATQWGLAVANRILADREGDGANSGAAFVQPPASLDALEHQPDPTQPSPQLLHAPHWGKVKAFGFGSIERSYGTLPNPLTQGYVESFNLVKSIGQDISSQRTPDETEIGIFWAYDGAYKIGTPHRIYSLAVDAFLEEV